MADSPIGYWRMETTSAYNEVTSSNNTLVGTPSIITGPPGAGNAWSLNETQAIDLGYTYNDFTADNTWSFEAWFKRSATNSADDGEIWRRDGNGKACLIRMFSADVTDAGKIRVYLNGANFYTTARYDDGNWHHLVLTVNGTGTNGATLYIDGSSVGTFTGGNVGSMAVGPGSQAIGHGAGTLPSGEGWNGGLSDVAIYPTALSSTRVGVHYTQGSTAPSTPGGYTAQAMTAAATTVDAIGQGNVRNKFVADDSYTVSSNPTTNYGSQTVLSLTNNARVWIKAPSADLTGTDVITNSKLVLTTDAGGSASSGTLSIYRVTADWAEGTITHNTIPTTTLVRTQSVGALGNNATLEIDIDDVLSTTNYGVMLQWSTTSGPQFVSSEGSGTKPYVEYTVAPQANVNPTADPMTASATAVDPSVSAIGNASYTAQVVTASALVVDPDVDTEQFIDVDLDAEPMDAAATMPGGGFAEPVSVPGSPMTASAETVDAVVTTQRGPRVFAEPFAATATWKQPALVNDEPIVESEIDDRYFQRVYDADPHAWYRLHDKGSTAAERMGNVPNGTYVGDVLVGQYAAPDNRPSVHFQGDGGYIVQNEAGIDEQTPYYPGTTLEFSFRTTKENTFLMVGYDSLAGTQSYTQTAPIEIGLRGGKVHYKTHGYRKQDNTFHDPVEFTGFKNVADGQWHQVIIRGVDYQGSDDRNREGVEIYIDGTLDIRRYRQGNNIGAHGMFAGFPDYIGSRPALLGGGTFNLRDIGALPGSLDFEGDMSEVVFYRYPLEVSEIPWHYYLFMGWTPVEADPLEAFAFMTADNRGKGNRKRALYLWWFRKNAATPAGLAEDVEELYNPVPHSGRGAFGVGDVNGYTTFFRSITEPSSGAAYYDKVTDTRTIIDLEYDLDIKDYDVIMFGDWPDEGVEFDLLRSSMPNFNADYERLLSQLRRANDKGIGLMVTQPRLAIELGIVDRVEWADALSESRYSPAQGDANNLYDYGSAVNFPWNIAGDTGLEGQGSAGSIYNGQAMNTDPAFLANKAYFYGDTFKNDRFRVRAIIEDLTDIPSYMREQHIYTHERKDWGWSIVARKYLHAMDGLQIGDEFYYHGTNKGMQNYTHSGDSGMFVFGRPYGTVATPPGHVLAGTVVTTFGAKHWSGDQEVDNPYKDWATTIVLRPGDQLKGSRVGGKIFVNFSEQPNDFEGVLPVQILPGSIDDDGSATWADGVVETPLQREWEYSGTRHSLSQTSRTTTQTVMVTLPDGTMTSGQVAGSDGLYMTMVSELYDKKNYPYFTMVQRGFEWLKVTPEINEGDVFPQTQPMVAQASIPNPTVVAEKDADATGQPMRAVAQMPKVAEDESGDFEFFTLPMEATAEFTGFSNVVSATPMTATAELVESFDMVHTTGEQVVLTLHGLNLITLYLKEEE